MHDSQPKYQEQGDLGDPSVPVVFPPSKLESIQLDDDHWRHSAKVCFIASVSNWLPKIFKVRANGFNRMICISFGRKYGTGVHS